MVISQQFSPVASSSGGLLLGLAAVLLVRCAGRVFGNSGIIREAISVPWKRAVFGSMLTTGGVCAYFFGSSWLGGLEGLRAISLVVVVVGGFLVGCGTTLANGCTSGHGVCGLARFSKRSMVAVPTFMLSGCISAMLTRQIEPSMPHPRSIQDVEDIPTALFAPLMILAGLVMIGFAFRSVSQQTSIKRESQASCESYASIGTCCVSGSLFSVGLVLSRMCDPRKVLNFLDPSNPTGWDPSLCFTMFFALSVTLPCMQTLHNQPTPTFATCYTLPPLTAPVDSYLVFGSVLFGVGWGMLGLCPGPVVVSLASGSLRLVCFFVSMISGMWLASSLKNGKQAPAREGSTMSFVFDRL